MYLQVASHKSTPQPREVACPPRIRRRHDLARGGSCNGTPTLESDPTALPAREKRVAKADTVTEATLRAGSNNSAAAASLVRRDPVIGRRVLCLLE